MAHEAKWISASPEELVTDVAARSLKARLYPVQQYLPLAAENVDDIEDVHNLRVWSRRADAAIDMYRPLLPEWRAAWIEKQLKRIRKATNDARDADVLTLRLEGESAPAVSKLVKRLRKHRAESQAAIVDVCDKLTQKKQRLSRRVEKLLKRVRLRGKHVDESVPTYREWSDQYLPPIVERLLNAAAADLENIKRLHQFRIEGKRLRYAMELLSDAYDSQLRNTAYPFLESLQDRLGQVNDHATAVESIKHWMGESKNSAQLDYLDEMLQREKELLVESHHEFLAWWSDERLRELTDSLNAVLNTAVK